MLGMKNIRRNSMKIPQQYKGKFFYHFTHVDNIESTVQHGLLCTNLKKSKGIGHFNVANENIQHRRSQMSVNVGPGGVVHDYVPFYLTTINPMLLGLLNRKNIDQQYVVFIAVSIEKILESEVIFTDASANTSNPPHFFEKPEDLDRLNWGLIDSPKWSAETDQGMHEKMAEVLVYRRVPLEWIDSYIVFNKISKHKIKRFYKDAELDAPNISYEPFNRHYFYYTKFFFDDRKNETLVTGPVFLYNEYVSVVKDIVEHNNINVSKGKKFKNISDAIIQVRNNFCVIPELEGIYGLQTDNREHGCTVSEHTQKVVSNLSNINYYNNLAEGDKKLVELAAYLHDIGKGPKEKWKDSIQKVYIDHPADAIPMLKRILTEEFDSITEEQVRKICLLVIYHDLLGDIIGKGRSEQELLELKLSQNEFSMLAALSVADVKSISYFWALDLEQKLPSLLSKVMRCY